MTRLTAIRSRIMISDIEVHSPPTLAEAYAVLRERGARLHVLAGGTDLMVSLNTRLLTPKEVLNIWHLNELRGISLENSDKRQVTSDEPRVSSFEFKVLSHPETQNPKPETRNSSLVTGHSSHLSVLRIGALTTYTQLIRSPLVVEHCPILVEAVKTIGAIQTQNRGTIGGNIVNASPAGDTLPVLAVLDAELELGSYRSVRVVPFSSFYTGYRQTVLAADELLLAIRIPPRQPDEHLFFYKLGTRRAQAISKVVIAAKAQVEPSLTIRSIQIGLGSVAPTVIRARNTEALLTGQTLSPALIEQAREAIQQEIQPITDFRSTEHYRRTVAGNLLARFLRQLLAPAERSRLY